MPSSRTTTTKKERMDSQTKIWPRSMSSQSRLSHWTMNSKTPRASRQSSRESSGKLKWQKIKGKPSMFKLSNKLRRVDAVEAIWLQQKRLEWLCQSSTKSSLTFSLSQFSKDKALWKDNQVNMRSQSKKCLFQFATSCRFSTIWSKSLFSKLKSTQKKALKRTQCTASKSKLKRRNSSKCLKASPTG